MARPLWFVGLLRTALPGRFLLAKLTRVPFLGRFVDRLLFEGDRMLYLPHDRLVLVNEAVAMPEEMVLPSQVVEHFIRQAGHHFVMHTCICREAGHCRDYPVDLGCLFLGDAVLGINPKLGRLVSRDEALAHVQRCRDAGLVHLIGRNKLDTVWLGVGPGDRLLTICNCCPCCCLWRMLPDVAPQIGAKVTAMPGVVVEVTDRCVGCGACTQGICFVGAIRLEDGRATIGPECRGCGRCVAVCPQGAIELRVEDARLVEATIERLEPLFTVL